MERFIFNFVFTHRRQLFIIFIVFSVILCSIMGFVSQANLPVPVKIFIGGMGGVPFGIVVFLCVFGLLDIGYQRNRGFFYGK